MEIMIVLAFLAVLILSSTRNKVISLQSRSLSIGHEKWVESVTDKEYEERLIRVFEKKNVHDDDKILLEQLSKIKADNPECVSVRMPCFYSAMEWDIPIMLAVSGKLPSYQLGYGNFEVKPDDRGHVVLYKWIESQVCQRGVDVTLFATGLGECNPRRVDNVDEVNSTRMMWRRVDNNGNPMRTI